MTMVELGDLVTIKGGGTPDKSNPSFWGGNIPWASVKDLNRSTIEKTVDSITPEGVKASATQIIPSGSIIVPTRMAVGRVAINTIDLAINQDLKALFPNKRVDTKYLYHCLLANAALLEKFAKGATVKGITLPVLKALKLPLPSLEEQRRIAALLDKADELRSKRRQALQKLGGLAQAVFVEMFGEPESNPEEWVLLGELCEVKGGKRLPKGEDYSTTPTSYRYIRVSDIERGCVREDKLLYLKPEVQKKICRYIVNEGDVVISIAGTIGLTAPIGTSLDGANLTENAAKIKALAPKTIHPVFLSSLLQSSFCQDQIKRLTGQVTIGKLALFRIEKLKIIVPSYEDQEKFAERLSQISSQFSHIVSSAQKLEAMFSALQNQAFKGEL